MAAELNLRTRERILDGAMAAIARHGLSKLGMSDVSHSAGVSRGTLYRYFPSREASPGASRRAVFTRSWKRSLSKAARLCSSSSRLGK